jgi:hypothetical protein
MIQRIQTVYLALATICAICLFFLPFAHFYAGDLKISEYAMFGVFNVQSDTLEMNSPLGFPFWPLAALLIIEPLGAIFLYKKRPVQLKFVRLAFLLNLAAIVYLFFAIAQIQETLYDESISTLYHSGFYMPVAALVFCFLAVRGIKNDEALVKSLDRIR